MRTKFWFVTLGFCVVTISAANARYYDVAVGRFISPDSVVPNAADPQSLNRYAYSRNNPVNLTDPSGNSWLSSTINRSGNWVSQHREFAGLTWQTLDLFSGSAYLSSFGNGRAILAGQVVAAGSFGMGGTSAGWGAIAGESISARGAHKTGRNVMSAMIRGGIEGGIMGATMHGIDQVGMNPLMEIAIKGHIGGMMAALNGGRYEKGFIYMAAAASAEVGYKQMVGYAPDATPGKELPGGTYDKNIYPSGPQDYDVVGFDEPKNGNWFHDNFGVQGSPAMRTVNVVPGGNAFAHLHDQWMNTVSWMPNFPSMAVAAPFSFGALMGSDFSILSVDLAAH